MPTTSMPFKCYFCGGRSVGTPTATQAMSAPTTPTTTPPSAPTTPANAAGVAMRSSNPLRRSSSNSGTTIGTIINNHMDKQQLRLAQKDIFHAGQDLSSAGLRLNGTQYEADFKAIWLALVKLNNQLIKSINNYDLRRKIS